MSFERNSLFLSPVSSRCSSFGSCGRPLPCLSGAFQTFDRKSASIRVLRGPHRRFPLNNKKRYDYSTSGTVDKTNLGSPIAFPLKSGPLPPVCFRLQSPRAFDLMFSHKSPSADRHQPSKKCSTTAATSPDFSKGSQCLSRDKKERQPSVMD
ncbi:hypothetical protein T439DRAFT_8950 [Meredithblackwellia eburnea MCA 4105]